MARILFDDPAKLDKARKMLVYLIWLNGHVPVTRKGIRGFEPASHKVMSVFLSGKCRVPTSRGEVSGLLKRWPFPKRSEMSKAMRQLLIDAAAKPFADLFAETVIPDLLPPWYFSVSPLADDARPEDCPAGTRAAAVSAMRKFCLAPAASPGRGSRRRDMEQANRFLRDVTAHVLEYCEATGVLADEGDDRSGPRRTRLARMFYEVTERAKITKMKTASMELGGRVDAGPKNVSDGTHSAQEWRAGLHRYLSRHGLEGVMVRLEQAFVAENWRVVDDDTEREAVKFALDVVAVYTRDLAESELRERWNVSLTG